MERLVIETEEDWKTLEKIIQDGIRQAVKIATMKKYERKVKTPGFYTWASMLRRCTYSWDQAYPSYGGRGIKVCDRWRKSFYSFIEDMGEKPAGMTLDRIDNNGNYEPGNCRWATAKTQTRNRRNTRRLTYGGETRSLTEWAETKGISIATIRSRLRWGWSDEAALSTPTEGRQRKWGADGQGL